MFEARLEEFRRRLAEKNLDVAIITNEDNVYYLTGYHDYLHMEFGRPTILLVPKAGDSLLITPAMELDMARAAARVDRIASWNDGAGTEWREELPRAIKGAKKIGIEQAFVPQVVESFIVSIVDNAIVTDVTPVIAGMRMIKSDEELQLARHAGQVAMVMMDAAREAIGDGVREFEVTLAASRAGTVRAAELLEQHYPGGAMSPNIHFLQIMASGDEITKSHHRASTRIMRHGEPVFLCFCGMASFNRFKLGFDRTFWIGEIKDERQAELYEIAVASQEAALQQLRPGVTAESVHEAYADVIQSAGFEYPFRCGRATGFSYLEQPELVFGDKTVLQPGMVFAVDGSVTLSGAFRAQVGDSFIITPDGHEQITHHTKSLNDLVI